MVPCRVPGGGDGMVHLSDKGSWRSRRLFLSWWVQWLRSVPSASLWCGIGCVRLGPLLLTRVGTAFCGMVLDPVDMSRDDPLSYDVKILMTSVGDSSLHPRPPCDDDSVEWDPSWLSLWCDVGGLDYGRQTRDRFFDQQIESIIQWDEWTEEKSYQSHLFGTEFVNRGTCEERFGDRFVRCGIGSYDTNASRWTTNGRSHWDRHRYHMFCRNAQFDTLKIPNTASMKRQHQSLKLKEVIGWQATSGLHGLRVRTEGNSASPDLKSRQRDVVSEIELIFGDSTLSPDIKYFLLTTTAWRSPVDSRRRDSLSMSRS